MASAKHRLAFVLGTVVGATVGIAAAFRTSELQGRQTRDQVQQSLERVLFKILDMSPFENVPRDIVTDNHPGATATAAFVPPVDIVIESRPSELSAHQTS